MVKAKDLLKQNQNSDDSTRKYRSLEDIEEHLSRHTSEEKDEDTEDKTSLPIDEEEVVEDINKAKKDDDLDSEDDEVDNNVVTALNNNPAEEEREEDLGPKATFSPAVNSESKSETQEENDPEDLPRKRPQPFETNLDDLATESKAQDNPAQNISSDFPVHNSSSLDEEESFESDIPRLGNNPVPNNRNPIGPEHQGQSNFSRQFGSYQLGERPQRGGNKWHVIILLLLGLAIIAGTIFFLKDQFMFGNAPIPSPSSTKLIDVPVVTPEPTPQAIDRTKFKVRVLNGTTKSGLAASVSGKLKTLGYQSDRVSNAPKQDFSRTEIKVKPNNATLSGQLIKDLLPDFDASLIGELKDSDTADAEVILGLK